MTAVRFGAEQVFRSEESTITDEDIEAILERGRAKTKELSEKLQKAEKGDLLDFRLDGGISAQTFEGIDYCDKQYAISFVSLPPIVSARENVSHCRTIIPFLHLRNQW